jgi:hypothetical protein
MSPTNFQLDSIRWKRSNIWAYSDGCLQYRIEHIPFLFVKKQDRLNNGTRIRNTHSALCQILSFPTPSSILSHSLPSFFSPSQDDRIYLKPTWDFTRKDILTIHLKSFSHRYVPSTKITNRTSDAHEGNFHIFAHPPRKCHVRKNKESQQRIYHRREPLRKLPDHQSINQYSRQNPSGLKAS